VVPVMTRPRPTAAARPRPSIFWLPFVAVGTLVTIFVLAVTSHIDADTGGRGLDALGVVLIAIGGVSIALSPRWPRVAFGINAAAIAAYVALGFPNGPFLATALLTLGVMSRLTDRRTALVGAAGLCSALALAELVRGGDNWFLPVMFIGWSAGAVFFGEVLRTRRTRLAELQERARTLERTREEEARRRVAEDRLQIARDLHDGVAHAMTTINVQAGAAAHVMDRHPEAAKEALVAIRRASGDVLDELTAMVALLREGDQPPDLVPTPGIEQIGDLVQATRDAGIRVTLAVEGPTDTVPKPVGTAAYRIVQESLTNVLRHAHATTAEVGVRVTGDEVSVEVRDDGTGSASPSTVGTGLGIRGMRERAEATGGRLVAGPRADGGFTVSATWHGRE
jgi:signal transduction histidine kinase